MTQTFILFVFIFACKIQLHQLFLQKLNEKNLKKLRNGEKNKKLDQKKKVTPIYFIYRNRLMFSNFKTISIDADEEKKREELRLVAKKELDEWYKIHKEQIAKTKDVNR